MPSDAPAPGPQAASQDALDHEQEIYDVLIIGAGPCGLAAAARIREQSPSAMFTDEEHRRFHWLRKHGSRVSLKRTKSGRVTKAKPSAPSTDSYRLAILDQSDGKWLGRWKRLFSAFDISHLRSPMLWHVDPLDRDSLLSYGHMQGRADELVEIRGCVGKEMSKHQKKKRRQFSGGRKDAAIDINQRDQWDYYTPSQSLFSDHCSDVADRYNLNDSMVHHEAVRDIQFDFVDKVSTTQKVFTVVSDKSIRYARAVILAVGPANNPVLPTIPTLSYPGQEELNRAMPQACHSMHIPQHQFPDALVGDRIANRQRTNILVVGGGLTSAQLSDLAIRRGVTKVWHIMRGPLRSKAFDVDLDWMGKYKTLNQSYFHQADSDQERLRIIKEARGGGSIPPAFLKRIRPHMTSGRLQMFERTLLTSARFEVDGKSHPGGGGNNISAGGGGGGGRWIIQTEPPIEGLPPMDFLYFATGIQSDFTTLPYLQTIQRDYPIPALGGLPCLNEDLMWKDEVPLFVTGRLAALRLGPAGPNIGGARIGAERITLALDDYLLRTTTTTTEAGSSSSSDTFAAAGGGGGGGGDGSTVRSSKRAFLTEEETVQDWDKERRDSGVGLFNYACGTGSKYSVLMDCE